MALSQYRGYPKMATFMGKSMITPITPPNLVCPMFQTHQEPSRMLQGARTIHTTRPEATLQRCRQHLNRGGTGAGANKVLDRKLVEPPNAGTNHEWFCTPNNKLPSSFSGNIGNGLYNPSPKGWFTIGFTTLGPLILGEPFGHLVATCGWEDSTLTLLSLCGRIPYGLWKSWQWGLSDIAITHNMDAHMAYG